MYLPELPATESCFLQDVFDTVLLHKCLNHRKSLYADFINAVGREGDTQPFGDSRIEHRKYFRRMITRRLRLLSPGRDLIAEQYFSKLPGVELQLFQVLQILPKQVGRSVIRYLKPPVL